MRINKGTPPCGVPINGTYNATEQHRGCSLHKILVYVASFLNCAIDLAVEQKIQ